MSKRIFTKFEGALEETPDDKMPYSLGDVTKLSPESLEMNVYKKETDKRFMQFRLQNFEREDCDVLMVQGIDVSYNILYDNAKAQKEILEVSNACVSHEMRNPMNSISAINEAKKAIY